MDLIDWDLLTNFPNHQHMLTTGFFFLCSYDPDEDCSVAREKFISVWFCGGDIEKSSIQETGLVVHIYHSVLLYRVCYYYSHIAEISYIEMLLVFIQSFFIYLKYQRMSAPYTSRTMQTLKWSCETFIPQACISKSAYGMILGSTFESSRFLIAIWDCIQSSNSPMKILRTIQFSTFLGSVGV